MERFVEVCRGRSFKVNAGKSKVMVLNREEGLECEVCVLGMRLELVLEFKYLGYVLDESGTDEAECSRNAASGRRVADVIRSLVKARYFDLECARVLHATMLAPVLMCGNETMTWKKKQSLRLWMYRWIT